MGTVELGRAFKLNAKWSHLTIKKGRSGEGGRNLSVKSVHMNEKGK